MRDLINLVETGGSLSRVLTHMQGDFAILSAFRGGYDERKTNLQLTHALIKDFMSLGLGGLKLTGHWIENEGTDEQRTVEEISFLVPNRGMEPEAFANAMIRLGRKYQQEAILLGTGEGVYALDLLNNSKVRIGDPDFLVTQDVGQYYSTIKNKKFAFGAP